MAVNKSRKRAGKRAIAPPQPVVCPIVPGGHKETVGTDWCPVEECPVTFASKNNEQAITIHVKAIVKKGKAYYADKKKGVGFWDAHNKYYEDKMEQGASTEAKKQERQGKYRKKHREEIGERVKLSQDRAKAKEQVEEAKAKGEEPGDLEVIAQEILKKRKGNPAV
ncbi:hypothetical protein FN846DRAFT_913392 [Sphaerosporella brunnea]|uniref:Uncharacterized protein n=1 Tax=Sphaerosporella brunnea TaxID=1250544 RepID=A0A5J5EGV9_9PEZI|nr:hypothetical protein FN846DRAFT_913392 [Sphaerosporella brunnea]